MSHSVGELDEWTVVALEEMGAAIRSLRQRQLMTQRVMADRAGLSQSTISRLENGLAPGLRIAWLARILAGMHRDPGPPGSRSWEVWTPSTSAVFIEPFRPGGPVEVLVRAVDAERREAFDAELMQLQASLAERANRRIRSGDDPPEVVSSDV